VKIKTRTDLCNHLIASNGYRRYLEIGVGDPRDNFAKVDAAEKHGVDPDARRPVTFQMTSDAFFAQREASGDRTLYDLVFIDGLHVADQAERDVLGSLALLAPDGALVLHECNPLNAKSAADEYIYGTHWNGTVWKAWVKLRATRPDLFMCVIDIDEGCGIIRRGAQTLLSSAPTLDYAALDYAYLAANRREALNLISLDDFLLLP
jgi:hypothetical protein